MKSPQAAHINMIQLESRLGDTSIFMSGMRTTLLLAGLTGLLLVAGQAMGGQQGVIIALIFAAAMNFGSYWFSDKLVLQDLPRKTCRTRSKRRYSTAWCGSLHPGPACPCPRST